MEVHRTDAGLTDRHRYGCKECRWRLGGEGSVQRTGLNWSVRSFFGGRLRLPISTVTFLTLGRASWQISAAPDQQSNSPGVARPEDLHGRSRRFTLTVGVWNEVLAGSFAARHAARRALAGPETSSDGHQRLGRGHRSPELE